MRRGEFRRWSPPGAPVRGWYVLIVSADEYHQAHWPVAMQIGRAAPASLYVVALADADPIAGHVAVHSMAPLDPAELSPPEGMITGATLELVNTGLRTMLGL